MILENLKTGGKLTGLIEKVNEDDLKNIKNSKNFGFDWISESKYELYKIRILGQEEILGLISIIDIPKEFRIHINLLESSKKYRGKNKEIKNIPGCLISYCCKLAFEKGYDGFVSLIPKTKLVSYYQKNYGFVQVGTQMAVFMEKSELLIKKYQRNEKV